MQDNFVLKKVSIDEIYKLKRLFPGTDEVWRRYSVGRIKQFEMKKIDVYVIEYNNEFIGEITVNYTSHDLPTETIENQRVYLEAFRLDKEFRGKGLGQKLIAYVLNDLEKCGYCEFTIGVEKNNERAKHIYFKYGFTEAIDEGHGNEYDPCDYILYMRKLKN